MHFDFLNVQDQPLLVWPASFAVARSYLDQLARSNGIARDRLVRITAQLEQIEAMTGAERRTAMSQLSTQLQMEAASATDPTRVRKLAAVLDELVRKG